MPDAPGSDWPLGSIHHRIQKVVCPTQAAEATVLAASWKTSRTAWTAWSVVDCSILPAGFIRCHETCVDQLGRPEPIAAAKVAVCGNLP